MKTLAVLLLISCAWDTVKSILIIDRGRRERDISIKNIAFHLHMLKGVGRELILNIIASVFFVVYLFN